MDREAIVWDAIRALTYSEMVAFATQLRDTADCIGQPLNDAHEWARVLQGAMDAYDDREDGQ